MIACFSPSAPGGETPRLSTSTSTAPRARVVSVSDPLATEALKPVPFKVHQLVQRGIVAFTGKLNPVDAWRSIVNTQEVIGIKVFSFPGSHAGTRVSVVEGIVQGLLAAAVPNTNIVVWDRRLADLQRGGFGVLADRYGVRLQGSVDSGWDEKVFYESPILGHLIFGDREFQATGENLARKSHVTTLLTDEIKKVINVTPLLNHNSAGVCGNLYSLALGSIDNSLRFDGDAGKLAMVVPEIYSLEPVGDRVVLNIVDALVCQYQGEQVGYLHYSTAFNQLRFSTDPVALDVLSISDIQEEKARRFEMPQVRTNRFKLYEIAELLEIGIADLKRIDVTVQKQGEALRPPPAE